MALPALLGAGARAVGGSMVKAGGRAAAGKVLGRGRKKQAQPGRIVPGREGVDGGDHERHRSGELCNFSDGRRRGGRLKVPRTRRVVGGVAELERGDRPSW